MKREKQHKTKELIKQSFKKEKGITLIALVITIIVLIILVGISISLVLGENGIFSKAKFAKEKTLEEAAREKVEFMLSEWQIEKAGNNTTLDYFLTSGDYNENIKNYSIVPPIIRENEYYIATVDMENGIFYEVTINAENSDSPYVEAVELKGKRLRVASIVKGYAFEGGQVEIDIQAEAPNGETITSIENTNRPEDAQISVKDELTNGAISFQVNKRGKYVFLVKTSKEDIEKEITVNVTNILAAPVLTESDIIATITSLTINLNTRYPQNVNIKYKYVIGEFTSDATSETTYTKDGLVAGQTYDVKVIVYIEGDEQHTVESNVIKKQLGVRQEADIFKFCQDNNLNLTQYGFTSNPENGKGLEYYINSSSQYGGGHGNGKKNWSWELQLDENFFNIYSQVQIGMQLYAKTGSSNSTTSTVSASAEIHYKDETVNTISFGEELTDIDKNIEKTLVFDKNKQIDYLVIKCSGLDNDTTSSKGYVNKILFS